MATEKRGDTAKPKGKPRGKPFAPGNCANPGGRPKKTQEEVDLIAACKAKTTQALAVIEEIMLAGENERNRLAAAQAILERAWGKPVQPQEISGTGGGPLVVEIVRFGANPAS